MICPHHGGTSPRKNGGSSFPDGPRVAGRSLSIVSNPMGRELCWFCSFSKPQREQKPVDCSSKHMDLGRGARDFLYPAKSHTRRKPEKPVKPDGQYDHLHFGVAASLKQRPASLHSSSLRPAFGPPARTTTVPGILTLATPRRAPSSDTTPRVIVTTPRPSGSSQIDRSTASSRNRARSENLDDQPRLLHSERPNWGPRVPSTGRQCTSTPYRNRLGSSATADSGANKSQSAASGTPREKVDALRALQSAAAFLNVDHEMASTTFLKSHLEHAKHEPARRPLSVASETPRDSSAAAFGAVESSAAAENTATEGGSTAAQSPCTAGPRPFGHAKVDNESISPFTRNSRVSGGPRQPVRRSVGPRAGVESSLATAPRLALRLQVPVRCTVASSGHKTIGTSNLVGMPRTGANLQGSEGAVPEVGSSASGSRPSLHIGMARSQAAARLPTAAGRTTDGSAQQRSNTNTCSGHACVSPDSSTSVAAPHGRPQAVEASPQQGVITLHCGQSEITFHGHGGLATKDDAVSEVKQSSAVLLESASNGNGPGCGGSSREPDADWEDVRQSARVLLRYPGASQRFVENMLQFLRKRRADGKTEEDHQSEITARPRSHPPRAVTCSTGSRHTSPVTLALTGRIKNTVASTSAASTSPQCSKGAAANAAKDVRRCGRARSEPATCNFLPTPTTTSPSCVVESQRSLTLMNREKTFTAQTTASPAPSKADTFVLHVPHPLSPTIRSHCDPRPAQSSPPLGTTGDDQITKSSHDIELPRDVSDDGTNVAAEATWPTAASSNVGLTAKDDECAAATKLKQDANRKDGVAPQRGDWRRARKAHERAKPRYFTYALPSTLPLTKKK